MERVEKAIIVGVIGLFSAGLLLGLTVFPFQYGIVEGSVMAGLLFLLAVFHFVLKSTTIWGGTGRP